jgi:uncharacterized protein
MTNSERFHTPEMPSLEPVVTDAGLRQYLLGVYSYMAGGLALTGLTAYLAAASGLYQRLASTPLYWLILFAPLALVFYLSFRVDRMSLAAARFTFWVYAILVGLSLSGIFLVYTGASIAQVFFITSATFGALSLFGYTTGADLSRFSSFLFMGLIGIIIASLVNLFLRSTAFQFAISIIGVLFFAGLTAWDTQRIRAIYVASDDETVAGKKAVMGALALYLDFLNLFLLLLQVMGSDRRR